MMIPTVTWGLSGIQIMLWQVRDENREIVSR
jgi:hypothetical protein